ncbi:MAG: CRTAC1 family protein [Armatimonadetes bacterium]|nr:CRTAC1 family protein [Armatimonadota bacterium]
MIPLRTEKSVRHEPGEAIGRSKYEHLKQAARRVKSVMLPFLALILTPRFVDVTTAMGMQIGNDQACWVDVDNDGWTDLIAGGVVWHNEKGKGFTKLAEGVGVVVAADMDNDGYPDLFSWSQTKLYRNVGGKSFTAVPLPTMPPTVSRGASWGDFDNDGLVDLYIGGYEDWDKQITYPSFILMNRGAKGFEVTWTDASYRSRGITACDFNRDGWLDVYASNYRLQPNELWVNDGKGKFASRAGEFNAIATSAGFDGGHSIGAAWGDFDNDGEFDLFAGNFAHVDSRGDQPKSRFLHNLGPKTGYKFEDKGTCGVWYQESYASPAAADFDNDTNLDLYFTTVYGTASFNKPNFPVLYRNEGDFKFADVTDGSGLEKQVPTYQAAFADFRNDGRLGLCTAGKLFANEGDAHQWIDVRLEGDGKRINRSAIGAQVRIKLKNKTLTRQVEAGTGEGNQNDLRLHFGLGDLHGKVDLQITWPGGRKQTVRGQRTNQIVTVKAR